jgi:beta-glucosidase
MRKNAKRVLAALLSASMVATGSMSVMAATTSSEISQREIDNKTDAKNIAAQGMVLLENKGNSLPISAKKGTKVALFGQGVYNTIAGGTGSGSVNQRDKVTVLQGFQNAGYDVVDADFVQAMNDLWTSNGGGQSSGWGQKWVEEPVYTEYDGGAAVEAAAAKTDIAIYVIARNSGEGSDRSAGKGDYLLSEDEEANLALLGEKFSNVIVVLNVGGVIDTKFFDEIDGLDSMLLMSQAGMTGGDAVVEVLNGTVNPSGKLTDTWPLNLSDNPSTAGFADLDGNTSQEVYNDDIYVGYRYYDTFDVEVSYPFGYGLSYTDFTITTDSVEADQDKVVVTATVKNVGEVSGKEVVEVYFSAPTGSIEKPYQELAGYAKTDELQPGESQTLTISYDTTEMGSYDESRAAYVMEKGSYLIRVGNSSRNTHIAAKLCLTDEVITEQYSNLMVPVTENEKVADDEKYPELDPISSKGVKPYTYQGEVFEASCAPKIILDFDGFTANTVIKENEDVTVYVSDTTETEYLFADNADGARATITRTEAGNSNSSDYTVSYDEVVKKFDGDYSDATLLDVYNGKITVEQFVSGLSLFELANLVNGHSSDATVKGVAGATWQNEEKGLVAVNLSDGPAGLRITQSYTQDDETYYQYATAWPIGTLIAQTWDTSQIYAYGEGVGEEMEEFGIGCWLAPGMNIHRNPLCGRNFEYYSEDPLVVGVTGTAATLGVQSNKGVGVTIKHYALNSQETNRNSENNTVSERAIREIYLKGFEMVVKQAQPMAIMTSYNQNNGRPAADDYDLCTAFARDEWGFTGMIMTDWGGGQAVPMYEMHAGNDLVCPGSGYATIIKGFKADPDWDGQGYVNMVTVYEQDQSGNDYQTIGKEVENWGGYVLDLNGTETVSTSVTGNADDDSSILSDKTWEMISEGYASYSVTAGWTWGSWSMPASTTVTYKVTSAQDSATNTQQISLGDVQKSAINVCNFVLSSIEFANAYGLEAASMNDTHADILQNITSFTKSDVEGGVANESLAKLLAQVKSLDPSEYTAESWAAVEAAIEAADAVLRDANAVQADVDAAVIKLVTALGGLEYGVETLHLETALEVAEAYLNTDSGTEELREAVEAGKAVLADASSTQEQIDAAANAVLDALAALPVNEKAESLYNLIEAAKVLLDGNYTSASLDNLQKAIEAAQAVLQDPNSTDADIAAAYSNIIDAIIQLEMKANKAALKAMIAKAEVVLANESAYVAGTVEGLADELAAAKEVYDNDDALQSDVNAAVKSLTLKVADARLVGDVDGDGLITTSDSAALLQYAAESRGLSVDEAAAADVNGDGEVDTSDAVQILQYAAEKITAF